MTTLDMAMAQLRSTKEPPGKRRTNNFLTRYRELMPNVKGECIDVTDDRIGFGQWAVYLAHHPQAREIFREPITAFHAEVFDEKDPNRGKMESTPLRVDFVCTRADRSAVRLHPDQIKEAKFVEGILEDWRKGKAAIHAPVLKEAIASRYKDGASKDEPLPPPPPSWLPIDFAVARPSRGSWVPPPPPGPPPRHDNSEPKPLPMQAPMPQDDTIGFLAKANCDFNNGQACGTDHLVFWTFRHLDFWTLGLWDF